MPQRLKSILALWFSVQIVLPFTAPLQTCDLTDLLGTPHHHSTPASPESTTTPSANEVNSEANSFVSPLVVSALRASTHLAVVCQVAISGPFTSADDLPSSPSFLLTVLRL